MKRSLLTLTISSALALTAAQADTTLYGSIRLGMDYAYNHVRDGASRGMSIEDQGSRLGIRGGGDLGNGTQVIFRLEWAFNAADGESTGGGFKNRHAYMGLSGDWGTFTIGRQTNPSADVLVDRTEVDNFNSDAARSASLMAAGSIMYGVMGRLDDFSASLWSRTGNSIVYTTPTWGGLNFSIIGVFNQGSGDEFANQTSLYNKNRNLDMWGTRLNYVHESGFYIYTGYLSADLGANNSPSSWAGINEYKRANVYTMQLGFDNEQWGVSLDFAKGENRGASALYNGLFTITPTSSLGHTAKNSSTGWDIGGHYAFGPNYWSILKATFGQAKGNQKLKGFTKDVTDFDWKESNKITTWAIGFQQKLSKQTRVWAEYGKPENKKSHVIDGDKISFAKTKDDTFSVGIRHDF